MGYIKIPQIGDIDAGFVSVIFKYIYLVLFLIDQIYHRILDYNYRCLRDNGGALL